MALIARISSTSDKIIHELVNKKGKPKIVIIEEALEAYRFQERMRFFLDFTRLELDQET